MTRREKILKAIRRESNDYIPYTFSLTPQQQAIFHDLFYEWDYQTLFSLSYRFLTFQYKETSIKWTKYYQEDEIKGFHYFDEFGIARSKEDYFDMDAIRHPLKYATIEDLKHYPFPKVELYDWQETIDHLQYVIEQNSVGVAFVAMTLFETSWLLCGYERIIDEINKNTLFIHQLLDILTDLRIKQVQKFAQIGVDVIHIGDDIGDKDGLLFDYEQWKSLMKPRLQNIIQTARVFKPDILIEYHGEGNIVEVIPDLIEIGVDILNPIEPESVDALSLKKQFGESVSFRGGLSIDSVLRNGTKEDVQAECLRLINGMSHNGGFILSPTQSINTDIPWDNFEMYLKTVKAYNRQKKRN